MERFAMATYLTPEELAADLKVDVDDIMSLIERGKLRAIRIGNSVRIHAADVEKLQVTCAAVPAATDATPVLLHSEEKAVLSDGSRWCLTRTGRSRFRVLGSIATGADIWPGKMQYPIKFSKRFMDEMLTHFSNREVRVGGKFDGPEARSLGEFIQQHLKTKMNPAVYLAALLIEEGYADPVQRGYIKFHSKSA